MFNSLYLFLKNQSLNMVTSPHLDSRQIKFKTSQEAKEYGIYELVVSKKQGVFDQEEENSYQLISHHLSFYEIEDPQNPYLSQYHYTAYFKDTKGLTYQLHVYSNKNDQLAMRAVLSVENDVTKGFDKVQMSETFLQQLEEFASHQSAKTISELRYQHEQHLQELENRYKESESQLTALSHNLVMNSAAYLVELDETIKILNALLIYPEGSAYNGALHLFIRIRDNLNSASAKKEEQTEVAVKEVNPSTETSAPPSASASRPNRSRRRKRKTQGKSRIHGSQQHPTIQTACIEIADKARAHYLSTQDESDEKQLEAFLESHRAAHNEPLLSCELSLEQLQQIQNLQSQAMAQGKKLLSVLLTQGRFDLALSLRSFLKPFPSSLAKQALATGNAELLGFLLENTDFPINTFTVEEGLSPVLYCFLNDSEQHPKAACLSLLIKHGASLTVKADDHFSVAHYILLDSQHRLRVALQENAATTLAQKSFYIALINDIHTYLAGNTDVDADETQRLTGLVEKYNGQMHFCTTRPPSATRTTTLADTRMKAERAKARDKIMTSPEFSTEPYLTAQAMLNEDPELLEKQKAYQQAENEYLAKLPSKEKRAYLRHETTYLQYLAQQESEPNFSSHGFKSAALLVFNQMITIVRIKSTLYDLSCDLKGKKGGKRRISQLEKQRAELIVELNKMQAELNAITHCKEAEDKKEKETKSDNQLLNETAKIFNDDEAEQLKNLSKELDKLHFWTDFVGNHPLMSPTTPTPRAATPSAPQTLEEQLTQLLAPQIESMTQSIVGNMLQGLQGAGQLGLFGDSSNSSRNRSTRNKKSEKNPTPRIGPNKRGTG